MSERETCETCRWWDRESNRQSTDGLCRKYAPRATVLESDEVEEYPVWPKTDIRDWCGEHQPREVKDD